MKKKGNYEICIRFLLQKTWGHVTSESDQELMMVGRIYMDC